METNVLDISGGGLAITVPSDGLVVEPGGISQLPPDAPRTGAIVTSLRVRNLFPRHQPRRHRSPCAPAGEVHQ